MAIRIKSKWSKTVKRKRTPEDYGSALSFISWRLSLDKAKTLHGEDFEYENDHQRVSIIVEYMSFQVHLVDRLLFEVKNVDFPTLGLPIIAISGIDISAKPYESFRINKIIIAANRMCIAIAPNNSFMCLSFF